MKNRKVLERTTGRLRVRTYRSGSMRGYERLMQQGSLNLGEHDEHKHKEQRENADVRSARQAGCDQVVRSLGQFLCYQ